MSSESSTELYRLTGFQILPPPDGHDIYTLIFRTGSVEWACIADPQILQKLSAIIQKHVPDPEPGVDSAYLDLISAEYDKEIADILQLLEAHISRLVEARSGRRGKD